MSGVDVLFRTYMASQLESAFDAAGTPIRMDSDNVFLLPIEYATV